MVKLGYAPYVNNKLSRRVEQSFAYLSGFSEPSANDASTVLQSSVGSSSSLNEPASEVADLEKCKGISDIEKTKLQVTRHVIRDKWRIAGRLI
jgi:hypothetical protein